MHLYRIIEQSRLGITVNPSLYLNFNSIWFSGNLISQFFYSTQKHRFAGGSALRGCTEDKVRLLRVGLRPRGFKRMAGRNPMNRQIHVRIQGGLEVKCLRSTRLRLLDSSTVAPIETEIRLQYLQHLCMCSRRCYKLGRIHKDCW